MKAREHQEDKEGPDSFRITIKVRTYEEGKRSDIQVSRR
jgi:hypothetical protein